MNPNPSISPAPAAPGAAVKARSPEPAFTLISAAKAGNYLATASNQFGVSTSDVAVLTLLAPPTNSYSAAVLELNPLVYYRFGDVTSGTGAFNMGSMGTLCTGYYEGACATDAGPQAPAFPVFGSDNAALSLDGSTADVIVPPPYVPAAGATIAAWVYKSANQALNAAIYYHRAAPDNFGLTVYPDPVIGGDALRYTWNGTYYTLATGLIVPTNQWAFTAMVVEPAKATVYLHDGTSMRTFTNIADHAAQNFSGFSYFGRDSFNATRRWNGLLDEAMLFDRALSSEEIAALYEDRTLPSNVELRVIQAGGNIILSWPAGTLQQADQVNGTYADTIGITSPYTNTPTGTRKCFRVRVR